jgi:transcription elongation factor Elf1
MYDYQCPNCKKLFEMAELKLEQCTPYSCDDCGNYLNLLDRPVYKPQDYVRRWVSEAEDDHSNEGTY